MHGCQLWIVSCDFAARIGRTGQKEQVMNGHDLGGPTRGHQERMGGMCHIHRTSECLNRRPFVAMPEVIQDAHGDPSIDDLRADFGRESRSRPVLPRARKRYYVIDIESCIGANQLMDVFTHASTVSQGGPIVDDDAHQEQSTRASIRYANVCCFNSFNRIGTNR